MLKNFKASQCVCKNDKLLFHMIWTLAIVLFVSRMVEYSDFLMKHDVQSVVCVCGFFCFHRPIHVHVKISKNTW